MSCVALVSVTHRLSYGSLQNVLLKLTDLGFQTGLLIQLMNRGLPEKLIWTLVAFISLNFGTCATMLWTSRGAASGLIQMTVDLA